MDFLQKLMDREVSGRVIAAHVAELLAKKLSEHGVVLSSKGKKELQDKVLAGDYSGFKLRTWQFWKRAHVQIEITESDAKELENSLNEWIERLPEFIDSLSDKLATGILETLIKRWPKQARWERRVSKQFLVSLEKHWEEPFGRLQMLLSIVREFGKETNKRLRDAGTSSYLIDVQTRLHARACQVASEVIALLKAGFADGAMARWRTLHEIAVVGLFISEGSESLAEKYWLHNAVESLRAAREYQKYCSRLGYERIEQPEIDDLEQTHIDLVQRFGPSFREQYGWAGGQLNIDKPSFADIERAVRVDHLRPFYRMASHSVHANSKGAFYRLGLLDENDLLLAGPSNFGLADPGQSTAMSLVQVTTALATLDSNLDGIVIMKLLTKFSDEVSNSFVAVQQQMVEGSE